MSVGSKPPHPVKRLRMRPVPAPDNEAGGNGSRSSASGKLNEAGFKSILGAYLDGLLKEDKFSGVVLVAKGDKPLFFKAYGLANKGKNIPNNTETIFNIGSMNKN